MFREYEPIYGTVECSLCSSTPVVGLRTPGGILASTGLCGPHFFGERLMRDPEEWNSRPESTE